MTTGRCYCGAVHYAFEGEAVMQGQCHCRECQYLSGGGANYFMVVPTEGFRYTEGEPKQFSRSDLERAVTREFCGTCGTHLTTRLSFNPAITILKVGTLDDPTAYAPQVAIWTDDCQPFHLIGEGVAAFPGFPPQG